MSPGQVLRRVLRWMVELTLAAGLVGVARQRWEAVQVRRGVLPAVTAATVTVPPPGEGRLAARLATWTPEAPETRAGRTAATVWAAPATAVGLLVGLSTGARPTWNAEHGCFVFDEGRTGAVYALRAVGAGANAIGQVVVSGVKASPLLLAHEAGHVRQAERLGVFLLPVYLWCWARYGYRHHPLERSARAAARRWLAQRAGRQL